MLISHAYETGLTVKVMTQISYHRLTAENKHGAQNDFLSLLWKKDQAARSLTSSNQHLYAQPRPASSLPCQCILVASRWPSLVLPPGWPAGPAAARLPVM